MAFHSHRGTPNGWFIRENPNLKWMITRGTPHFKKPQCGVEIGDDENTIYRLDEIPTMR